MEHDRSGYRRLGEEAVRGGDVGGGGGGSGDQVYSDWDLLVVPHRVCRSTPQARAHWPALDSNTTAYGWTTNSNHEDSIGLI